MVKLITKNNEKAVQRLPKWDGKCLLDIPAFDGAEDLQKFDIYYAKEENRKNRVLIDVHGGSYAFGTRKHNLAIALDFVNRGYDVITLDYRHPFGKNFGQRLQLQDLAVALRKIWDNAEEYGLNRNAIYLTGDSAGGHFALALAEASQSEEAAARIGIGLGGMKFRAVLVNCPVYDYVDTAGKNWFSRRVNLRVIGPHADDRDYLRELSPKTYFDSFTMPLFVSTCKKDFIRQESMKLKADADKLNRKDFEFLDIDSDDPKIEHVHNVIYPEYEESKRVNDAMDAFMNRY